MIVVDAYHRRRGWLAFHSGGAAMSAKAKLSDFMGQSEKQRAQSPDEMLSVLRSALAQTECTNTAK